ncbi:DNA primase [compost metagenome]
MSARHLDIAALKHAVPLADLIGEVVKLSKSGDEFKGCCPFHREKTASFTIFSGDRGDKYQCFGCDAKGDHIDFLTAYYGLGFAEAVDRLAEFSGGAAMVANDNAEQRQGRAKKSKASKWEAAIPPDDEPPPARLYLARVSGELPVVASWAYRDTEGRLAGYACRVEFRKEDGSTGKDVIPLTWQTNVETGEQRWRQGALPQPRLLYGAELLAANPTAQVILVEGEKATDAGRRLLAGTGLVVVSWPGGCKAVDKADWSLLAGRKVVGWPDCDSQAYADNHPRAGEFKPYAEQPGMAAMLRIAELVTEHGAEMRVVTVPEPAADEWPDGYDLADLEAEGWDGAAVLAYLRQHLATPDDIRASLLADPLKDFDGIIPEAARDPELPADDTEPPVFDMVPLEAYSDLASEQIGSKADKAIAELNRGHALVLAGDKALVMREAIGDRGQREIRFLTVAALRTFLANRRVPVETDDGPKMLQAVDLWLKSPERRTFEGVTFAPSGNAPAGYFNLWQGYTVEPLGASLLACAMKCRRLLSHMKYNLCRGDRGLFRYLLAWLADMFQSPDAKPGVALVMRGRRGVGKSKLADIVRHLLGGHAIKVSQSRHLIGNFNRHMADKLLIVAEESFWSGDHAAVGPLQDLITSESLTVEAKGVDAVEVRSVCRIMMITNDDWAVPAASDERRYFVLDVGDRRAQDHAYFAAIDRQMKSRDELGYRALLGLFLRLDLSETNLRAVPETAGLRNQRAHSLDPVNTFLLDSLISQQLAGVDWLPDATATKTAVYRAFIEHARSRGKTHLPAENMFAREVIRSLGLSSARGQSSGDRFRPWVWRLPRWDDAARRFEEVHKVDVFAQCPAWNGGDA